MRRLLVSVSCPWVFRSPKAHARKLRRLAATEQGSYLSLQWAAQSSPSLPRQALYLRHAADEARHAELFWKRARELERPPGPLLADAEDLLRDLGEARFLAFVHHGERRGREQFETYERYFTGRGKHEDAALFSRVSADERHHESYSRTLLVELAGSSGEAQKELRRVRLWEAWRSWKRSGRAASQLLYCSLIWALFPLLLPYALLGRLARARGPGFHTPGAESDPKAEPRPGALTRG